MKPRVLICVLCMTQGRWIHPLLAQALLAMSHDERFASTIEFVTDVFPVAKARNTAVVRARERGATWCVMIDADQSFPPTGNCLDVLEAAAPDMRVIAMPACMQDLRPNFHRVLEQCGDFFEVHYAGSGVLLIHRDIWQNPGPWFSWTTVPGDELGTTAESEDMFFCSRVRREGFKVWMSSKWAAHWKVMDATGCGMHLRQLEAQAKTAVLAGN